MSATTVITKYRERKMKERGDRGREGEKKRVIK